MVWYLNIENETIISSKAILYDLNQINQKDKFLVPNVFIYFVSDVQYEEDIF